MAFPTLSAAPRSCPESVIDDTIKTDTEAGYVQTRPRFTKIRRTFGPIQYLLNRADRDLLVAHDESVKGSTIFTWTHPITGTSYNVRYKSDGRVKTEPLLDSSPRLFSAEFSLEEV
jgi:hypothetical protein